MNDLDQTAELAQWQALINEGNESYAGRKYTDAELKFAAALRMAEKWAANENLEPLDKVQKEQVLDRLAKSLNNMAALYHTQGKFKMAEDLYNRCLDVKIKLHGEEHPEVAVNLHNLAAVHSAKGRWTLAEPLYQRALEIREKAFGPEHHDLVPILTNYALMLKRAKRDDEAKQLEERLNLITQKS